MKAFLKLLALNMNFEKKQNHRRNRIFKIIQTEINFTLQKIKILKLEIPIKNIWLI